MRSPIELEKLFRTRLLYWKKEIEKRKAKNKQKFSYLSETHFEKLFYKALKSRQSRLTGISDMNHNSQNGFRKNNYLLDLFAKVETSPDKYRINPIGNFFKLDYPGIKQNHQDLMVTHQNWYKYRQEAIHWDMGTTIDWCAKSYAIEEALESKFPMDNSKQKSIKIKISERSGFMNSAQLAVYLGKSPATINRWLKDSDMPHSRQNGRALFKKEEIDNWLKN